MRNVRTPWGGGIFLTHTVGMAAGISKIIPNGRFYYFWS